MNKLDFENDPEKLATVVVCINTKNDAKIICLDPEVKIDVRIP